MPDLVLFNKPFRTLSQFTDTEGRSTLADYLRLPGFKPAGRLDYDSEGLLLLCDDGRVQQQIANPRYNKWKTYWVQIEGIPDNDALQALSDGLQLNDGPTRPARVKCIDPPDLWPRNPPVRYRKSVADCWLQMAIREGRNRQVRRMTAAVGHPTLRLVRISIDRWQLGALLPGEYRRITLPPVPPSRGKRK